MNVGLLMTEVVDSGATAGALLREARQACGMHIAALAVTLKVPVGKLEALEADDYSALPDTVFVRALAASVCRTLKIDSTLVLSLLPQSESPRLSANSAGLNAPVKGNFGKSSGMSSASFSGASSSSRPFAFVVLILLVGAMALYFYPRHKAAGQSDFQASDPTSPVAARSELPVDMTAAAPSVGDRSVSDVASAPVATSVIAAPLLSASSAVSITPESPVASAVAGSAPSVPAETLALRARSESWVQVRDKSGAVVLQRSLVTGESVSLTVPAPLAVVIGRADATEVVVRGKPFDLVPVTRENVARFEVK